MSAVILAVFLSRSRAPVANPRVALPAPVPAAPARPAPTQPGTIAPLLSAPKPSVAPAVAKYVPPTGPIRADKLDAQTLLKRFAGWSEAYAKANPEERAAMLQEGGALATARREVMREMIQRIPSGQSSARFPTRFVRNYRHPSWRCWKFPSVARVISTCSPAFRPRKEAGTHGGLSSDRAG